MSDYQNSVTKRIIPHLWYDKEAKEAAEFYCSIFPESKITSTTILNDTPSGDSHLISFELWGQPFMAISAGPLFKFNPSISFMVYFDPSKDTNASEKLEEVWNHLSDGGMALMPLGEYPFSKKFGWIQDKFGVSWQLMLTNPDGEPRPPIMPFLMFIGENYGKAEEAREFYLSVFKNSKPGVITRYGPNQPFDKEGNVMFTDFMLENSWFIAMDSGYDHKFQFNEAISFIVNCETQEEIDYYWDKLSAVPEAEQCGWLKDKFGVSWQISPVILDEMMTKGTPEQRERVTQAFLQMKKFDIATLQKAFTGK